MKLKLSGWLINCILAVLYSLAILILFWPWVSVIYTGAHFGELQSYHQFWLFTSVFTGVIVARIILRIEKQKNRVLLVTTIVILECFFLYLLHWPVIVFGPVFLLMLIFGLRFQFYDATANHTADFFLGVLLLLVNILVSNKIEIHFYYYYVISFFLVGVSFTIIYNIEHMKQGIMKHRNTMAAAIIICLVAGTVFLAILMTSILNSSIYEQALHAAGLAYQKLVNILLNLFAPFIYSLLYVIYTLINLIVSLLRRKYGELGLEPTLPKKEDLVIKITERASNTPAGFKYLPFIILGLILLVVLYRIFRKDRPDDKTGFTEERESVFSASDFKKDLQNLWNNLRNRFSRGEGRTSIYDGSTPVIVIREVYRNFLVFCNRAISYKNNYTPIEYLKLVTQKTDLLQSRKTNSIQKEGKDSGEELIPIIKGLPARLTELYNQARYGERAGWEEAEEAREIWQDISNYEEKREKGR